MTADANPTHFILTLSCPDRAGLVKAAAGFLAERGCNIHEAAQFSDVDSGRFFMRIGFAAPAESMPIAHLREDFDTVAREFAMQWNIVDARARMPTLLMVSKLGHCLHDLLVRWQTGILPIDIKAIVSNHRDFYRLSAMYDIPFHHIPVTPDNKPEAEAQLLRIIGQERVELVVLARYMQVLSDGLCRELHGKAINIHHSFLPSFKGGRPYHQAHERGVKIIGATAHYVTGDLDEGPIIEQDVQRADHSLSPADMTLIGRDVESLVLARAVKWHAEHRILMNGHRTVVFR